MATVDNNKIKFSGFTTKQKIQLPADDPLVDILKSQYYDLVVTAQLDGSVILTLPNSKPPTSNYKKGEEYTIPDDGTGQKPFPTLADITLKKIDVVNDINGNAKLKFNFNVKNNSGDAVRGVQGGGG
jgi:hypothetical protein